MIPKKSKEFQIDSAVACPCGAAEAVTVRSRSSRTMKSPANYSADIDKDLDDAALWAVIDSAAAASLVPASTTKSRKPLYLKYATPISISNPSPQIISPENSRIRHNYSDGDAFQEPWIQQNHMPNKIARVKTPCISELNETSPPPLAMVKHVQRTPASPSMFFSPETRGLSVTVSNNSPKVSDYSPGTSMKYEEREKENSIRHSLSGQFPSVSLFKEYQNSAMAVSLLLNYLLISPFLGLGGRVYSVNLIKLLLQTNTS